MIETRKGTADGSWTEKTIKVIQTTHIDADLKYPIPVD